MKCMFEGKERVICKIGAICCVVLCVICFDACGFNKEPDYSQWINSDSGDEQSQQNNAHYAEGITDKSKATSTYSGKELAKTLLENDNDKLADMLWQNQIANGVYSVSEEELDKNILTYYVSSILNI